MGDTHIIAICMIVIACVKVANFIYDVFEDQEFNRRIDEQNHKALTPTAEN